MRQKPSSLAKLICVLIIAAAIMTVWAIARSFDAQPTTTPAASQSLPEQAAHGSQTR
jgi:hypothetical protein